MWSQFTNVTDGRTDRQTTCNRNTALCTKVHHAVKTVGICRLQRCRWQYESLFIRLAVVSSQTCEIPRNSPKIRTYSSSRSSTVTVIDLGANRQRICNFILVINSNFWRISYSFRDNDAFTSKIACFTTRPSFDAHSRRNALWGPDTCINITYTTLKSEKYMKFEWATIPLLTVRVYLHSFS